MKQVERIETLRREIEQKKISLGLNSDILSLKSLKKYGNISALTFPKSVAQNYYYYGDSKKRFESGDYYDARNIARFRFVTDKIIAEVKKKIFSEISELIKGKTKNEVSELLNEHLVARYKIDSFVVSPETSEKNNEFVRGVFLKFEKVKINDVYAISNANFLDGVAYTSLDVMMKGKGASIFSNRTGMRLQTTDLLLTLATIEVVNLVKGYLFKDSSNYEFIINKLEKYIEFDRQEFDDLIASAFDDVTSLKIGLFDFLKAIIAITMEVMIQEAFGIQEYEERLRNLSGSYAKTYTTKKNIPKKIQSFMEDNHFLAMFDYVEADEQCDLEKLENLANEFVLLSYQLPLPKAKDHSLRFRRLGKIKAAGVYYPGYNTLAVDIDSVSSFVHEFFHFIDFDNGILSLNNDFKAILDKYRELMEEKVSLLDEDSSLKEMWEGKGKYNKTYYRSNEEAFARMGEMYVSEVLGIKTNFNRIDYSDAYSQIVYPQSEELLELIKNYYGNVFFFIKNNKTMTQF